MRFEFFSLSERFSSRCRSADIKTDELESRRDEIADALLVIYNEYALIYRCCHLWPPFDSILFLKHPQGASISPFSGCLLRER
jgi:hypothetical protein